VVDTQGTVHAFDAATGARRWEHKVEVVSDLRNSTFGGGASYFEGKIYANNGAGDVFALDAQTGAELWHVKPTGPLRGSPTVAFNAVYVMTTDNQIHALSMADGTPIWDKAAATGASGVFGVAAPAAGQGTVIAGYSSGELVAYRYENGRDLWSDALARTSISTQVGTLTDVDATRSSTTAGSTHSARAVAWRPTSWSPASACGSSVSPESRPRRSPANGSSR
jgi:outer membrane protein assembly factor BamB